MIAHARAAAIRRDVRLPRLSENARLKTRVGEKLVRGRVHSEPESSVRKKAAGDRVFCRILTVVSARGSMTYRLRRTPVR